MDPYKVLGVERDANEKTIKKQYRKLVHKWHPDVFHTEKERETAKLKMDEINEAFDILKNQEKRAIYDAEHPVSVYEYYASKHTKEKKKKTNDEYSNDIENEKQRRAVIQFFNVEYERKNEILDMFVELATGAVNNEFSEEEYIECRQLILEELNDCIANIQKIISVAKKKQIKGLESKFWFAEEVMQQLIQKGKETPKTLKEAHYVEETRVLTVKIQELMNGFKDRILDVHSFDLLSKTWEFENNKQLNSVRKQQREKVRKLFEDINWVQKTAKERKIDIGTIILGDPNSKWTYERDEKTLDECKQMLEENKKILNCSLQNLRKKFWEERCRYTEENALLGMGYSTDAERYKGNFICPPNISRIKRNALYWLRGVRSISIPSYAIKTKKIELPEGSLETLIFTFNKKSISVDVSRFKAEYISRKGEYICINGYEYDFILVDDKNVHIYDEKKICELNGVTSIEALRDLSIVWKNRYEYRWNDYELQIHTWAQVVKKLPAPNIMQHLPCSVETIKEWTKMDKTNFENAILVDDNELKVRTIRLYIALGALSGNYCHAQAEWLISKLDVSKMYRSRLERFPNEKKDGQEPMLCVPKSAVDLVQENIENKEFLPFVFAFLEGYNLFKSEAKKANIELSAEFIINTAPQYIFHRKVDKSDEFVKKLLETEKDIPERIADKIIRLYSIAKKNLNNGIFKNIVPIVDNAKNCNMHYKFLDIQCFENYYELSEVFKCKSLPNRYYGVEAENIFVSTNSNAIEIIDSENKRIAIVILNLLDKGELFADIAICNNKCIEVLETIKRALIDQKKCNNKITGISIGMNEAPRTSRYNEWRKVVETSNADWAKNAYWDKFEYLFKSRILGDAYKGYRVRFMIEGKKQYLSDPCPWDNPKKRRYKRLYY